MHVILGSRSSQRCQLLGWLLDSEILVPLPPLSSAELSFDGLISHDAIAARLAEVVQQKFDDVVRQVRNEPSGIIARKSCVMCADTVVVADSGNGEKVVLGKPDSGHQVRHWFTEYLSAKAHEVWTCFQIGEPGDDAPEHNHRETVRTTVQLEELNQELIDWYISTGEFSGKAGGYAIQGQGAALVKEVHGSLTNVIGLPVLEVSRALNKLGVPLRNGGTE